MLAHIGLFKDGQADATDNATVIVPCSSQLWIQLYGCCKGTFEFDGSSMLLDSFLGARTNRECVLARVTFLECVENLDSIKFSDSH